MSLNKLANEIKALGRKSLGQLFSSPFQSKVEPTNKRTTCDNIWEMRFSSIRPVPDKNVNEEEDDDDDLGGVRLSQSPITGLDITQLFFCWACNIKGSEKSVKNTISITV